MLASTATSLGGDRMRAARLWVRLAVALAFADASIVVLALPQIVDRLHTSISHVIWVIVAYNLALIAGSALILPFARRVASVRALVAGLAVFGLASIGCGASGGLAALIPLRCVQGAGGALILAASLPLFAGASTDADSPLHGWSAAAALGAAIGPAAGGILTQLFDWRSIFFAQAPVAAIAAIAVLRAPPRREPELPRTDTHPSTNPLIANLALTFLSAGLIGALFLVVIELINAWLVTPIGAAAIVSVIPIATVVTEWLVRGRSPLILGAAGAVLVAAGLTLLGLITDRNLGTAIAGLALCGIGLGLAFPGLTAAALTSHGAAAARAAKTIAARDAGLVLGLLLLTPVFVNQLNQVSKKSSKTFTQAAAQVIVAPVPVTVKLELAPKLLAAVNGASQTQVPDIAPAFAAVEAGQSGPVRAQLALLQSRIEAIINRAVTHAFRNAYLYGALLALIVLPLLALGAGLRQRGRLLAATD